MAVRKQCCHDSLRLQAIGGQPTTLWEASLINLNLSVSISSTLANEGQVHGSAFETLWVLALNFRAVTIWPLQMWLVI